MRKQFYFGAVLSLLICFSASADEWIVKCGDDLYCIARIDLVEAKGGQAKLKIERSNVENGKVYVTFGASEPFTVGMQVRIETLGNGFNHEGLVEKVYNGNEMAFTETARGPIVEALRGAADAQVTVRYGGNIGTRIQDVPLAGLTAALLQIDTAQGRIGRTDAMVAWGSIATGQAVAASQVIVEPPVQPRAEVTPEVAATTAAEAPKSEPLNQASPEIASNVIASNVDEEAPIGSGNIIYAVADLPPELAAFGKKFGCALDETLPAWGANALGMGGNSVFYTVPCQNGDVNIKSYVASMKGSTAKLYQFENQPGLEPTWRETVISPGFDPASGMLITVAYDSPNFDCGRFEQHRYLSPEDGFELIAVRVKADCDGVTTAPQEWPIEWTIDEMGG